MAATVALALALAACGGDEAPDQEAASEFEFTHTTPTLTDSGTGRKQASKQGDKDMTGAGGAERTGSAGQGGSQQAPADLEGCPEGMSPVDCQALLDSANTSKTLAEGECQRALSKKQCQALGKALEGQANGSRELNKNRCYSVLSKKQCRELGQALGFG